jgi:hypothetical protein
MKNKVFIFILFSILSYSKSHGQFFKPLLKDDIKIIKKNKSIVIWRVKIIDKTNYFNNLHQKDSKKYDFKNKTQKDKQSVWFEFNSKYLPIFEIFKRKEENKLVFSDIKLNEFRHDYAYREPKWYWSEKENASVLDELIMTVAKPADYFMDRIQFTSEYEVSNSGISKKMYNIKSERKFTVKESALIYLGRIEIVIYNFNSDPKVLFVLNKEVQQQDIDTFAEKMPLLYNETKNKIESEKLKMLFIDRIYEEYGNFKSMPSWRRPWSEGVYENCSITHKWVWGDGYKHRIKSNIDRCPFCKVKLNYYNMPVNYNINFISKWDSGVIKNAYGLILGKDMNNYYGFGASGSGHSIVWHRKDGELVENPVNWTSNSIYVGDGKMTNRHKIEVRDNHVKYYANDRLISEFKMDIKIEDWILGFQVCGKQNITFSKLIVEEID